MFFRDPTALIVVVPALLIAITFHEFAHGKMAAILGDPTPAQTGRLSLNPLKHLDVMGTLMLLIVGFGWAKPVQVNPFYFQDRRKGMIYTSLAGPGMNLVLAYFAGLFGALVGGSGLAGLFFFYLMWYNIVLAVFNLIPVPPLDGSKVLLGLLPPQMVVKILPLERYGTVILLILLVTGILGRVLIPLVLGIMGVINSLVGIIV